MFLLSALGNSLHGGNSILNIIENSRGICLNYNWVRQVLIAWKNTPAAFIWVNTLCKIIICFFHRHFSPLRWRHNDHAGVSNHQPHGCLLNRLFRRKSKKTSKLRVTGLCAGNSPGTGEFPAQMASYAENVSIWWRHHANKGLDLPPCTSFISDLHPQQRKIDRSTHRYTYRCPTRIVVSWVLSLSFIMRKLWEKWFYMHIPIVLLWYWIKTQNRQTQLMKYHN